MRRFLPLPPALAVLGGLVAGCSDRAPTAPLVELRFSGSEGAAAGVTAMTQNLYVGADVDAVIIALASPDPNDDVPALVNAIQTVGNTDFPARAEAIADEIARVRPHAVGLQEVEVLDIDLTPFGQPIVVDLDFLPILQAALAARNLHYVVAAQVQNTAAVPVPGISLVDYDAILVDADRVTVTTAGGQNFFRNAGPVAPGVDLKRGWVWTRVMIAGTPYTFVSTHTEPDLAGASLAGLREAQLTELVDSLAADQRVVMMGDFNDVPGSLMHQVVMGAGFTDAWAALRPGAIGYTCCHLSDLSDSVANFSQRIDYVFSRGLGGGDPDVRLRGKVDRFGEVPSDRTAGPAYLIWPSDHAGLIATLR
ncbi:MAG TPA: endonuclease/exonuclease/phosphatase family protein [Gemmatimonadales bacterium]|nr:endonuclease/exonuclease/phosphatase family protein [Gemmatimonadales bacterium]